MKTVRFMDVVKFTWRYFRRFTLTVSLAYLCMTIMIIAELCNPLIMGWLIDSITLNPTPEKFGHSFEMVILLVAQGVIYHVSLRFAHFLNCYTDARVERLVAAETLDHVQHLSADWHANSYSGATVTKIKRAMRAIHSFYDTICYELYPTTGIIIGMIILISFRQQTLGFIFAVFAFFYGIFSVTLSMKYVAPANRKANMEDSKLGGILADTLASNMTVKSFAGEKREHSYFEKASIKWMHLAQNSWMRGNIMSLIQSIINNSFKFFLLTGAIWLWIRGNFTPGDVVFIFSSYQLLTGYLRSIGDRIRDLNQSVNDMEDVIQLWESPVDIQDHPGQQKLKVNKGEIIFDNINFRYPTQTHYLFENFSLTIKPGEKIALVGSSGSGKSTFVKLIQRLYNIESGEIRIDSHNISKVTQKSLRECIGLVPQDPILFHRTLFENIAYGRPNASQSEIETAAKKAHAHEFIARLQAGYETLVGERGIKLSGGERQRVAIARAIVANRPIIILDEATSSLDSASERLIQDALENLLLGRTSIIIAHRLSTIKSADRILVFDHGRIIEEGSHSALLKKTNGLYRKLYQLQAAGFL